MLGRNGEIDASLFGDWLWYVFYLFEPLPAALACAIGATIVLWMVWNVIVYFFGDSPW